MITEEMVWRDNRTMKETMVPSEVTAFTSAKIQEKVRDAHWVKIPLITAAKERSR